MEYDNFLRSREASSDGEKMAADVAMLGLLNTWVPIGDYLIR
jgi:hypothetical protein